MSEHFIYVPVECEVAKCSLRASEIGEDAAHAIAALYTGPGQNLSSLRRKAEVILGRPLPNTSFRRHVDHLREGPIGWGDPADTFEGTYTQCLEDVEHAIADSTERWWELARMAVIAAGPSGPWNAAYQEAIDDLGRIDQSLIRLREAA
jgi:hypothetical protein